MFGNLALNGIIVVVGVLVLVGSSEYVVDKLIKLAHHYGVSGTFVGVTILAFSTSLPEIASHLVASFGILSGSLSYRIASSAVLGANIGSDVIQQTFILGLVIVFMGSLTFSKKFLKKSYSVMIGTTLMTLVLGFDGTISRLDGLILFGAFVAYIFYLNRTEDRHLPEADELKRSPMHEMLLVIIGLSVLLVSSVIVLNVVEIIVHETGIAGSMIGVFTLGIASALPEFFIAIMGIRKRAPGMAEGTLIGSNVTNPLVAIGLGGMISKYYVPKPLIYWDLPMETITAFLLLIYLFTHKRKLGKWGGIYLICLYFAYAIIRILFFTVD